MRSTEELVSSFEQNDYVTGAQPGGEFGAFPPRNFQNIV